MSKVTSFLNHIFHKKTEETTTLDDTTTEATAPVTDHALTANTPPSDTDILLNQVKELLVKVGHNVEPVFDEVVALARKLI